MIVKRPVLNLCLLFCLGIIIPGQASAQTFDDVPTDYWAFSFIEILVGNGITAGCGNGNYCPDAVVTRAQMAVFLERGMRGSNYSPPAATGNVFFDVGASDFAASFIEQLSQDGITAGCGNGNYCPDATVTRDQMAVFLLRAKYGAGYSPPAATGVFGDVPVEYWAADWIEQLAAEGITAGCGGGNYCPESPVNRDQMAVFLVRTFNLIGHNNNTCFGLDFPNTVVMPIRAATVQLLDASDNVLAQMALGDDGSYSFDNIAANTDVRIRVRAELKRGGAPNWDVEVRDNVDTSPTPPPLATRPLYVAQWAIFNTGVTNISDADFTAMTGWDSATSSYTSDTDRVAAPFAILDTIYTGMQLVLGVDATASFAPLDAFWSVNNTRTSGSSTNVDIGEIGGSFYNGGIDSLFLVGDALVDTGEFDFYVTLHEWGHYFEDNFSRSDSVGGRHVIGELIEARVSFGEGWATAVAAMATGDPMACNTGAASGAGSWGFNVETFNGGPQGWYNELSVAGLILDLFDTNNDGVDNNSIGFTPIYDVMTGPQTTTEAFTTLFSFSTLLRPNLTPTEQGFLDSLLDTENIETAGLDIWATTQNNINVAPNNEREVLPLYTDYAADGSTFNICTNSDHDPDFDGNKPAEHRYLRLTTMSTAAYDVVVNAMPIPPPTTDTQPDPPADPIVIRDRSDPDVFIFLNGSLVAFGNSGVDDSETFTTQVLPADTYVVDLQEWRFGDPDKSSDYPAQVCFDVTMTAQ